MFSNLRRQLGRVSIRLTLWHALLFLAAALTVLSITYFVIKKRLDLQERDVIELRLNQYANEYQRGGLESVRSLASLRKGREQKAFFVRLADPSNQTVFLRDEEDWAEFSPARLAEKAGAAEEGRSWLTLKSPTGSTLLLGSLQLPDGFYLQVGRSTEGLENLLSGFRMATFVVILVFLPASIIGGAFLASQMLRPLQHLKKAAEQIVETAKFDARVPSSGNGDELDALIQLFNEMLGRIERLIRGMNESLDNVAHDLRTPITRIRQKAQAALEADGDISTSRDALADCVEETERVTMLLNTLMDIAEAEFGLIPFQRQPIQITDLVASVVDSYLEVAEENKIRVESAVMVGWKVSGDEGALRRAFANLLDNAIKYTPPGGEVIIKAEQLGDSFAIHFTDTGCGIPPEDLPRIWDRLFRGDRSRTQRGLGLGLSFVRAIVTSHGGFVVVTSTPGIGTKVTVTLPVAKPYA